MKIKLMLALTALLIILAFISFFLGQKGPAIAPVSEKPAIEAEQKPSGIEWPILDMPLPKRAITVIKTPGKENRSIITFPDKENKARSALIDKENKRERANSQSQEAISGPEAKETSFESEAGIAIMNKQPAVEEQEEMITKGIVFY
jgi:hypothetical protein